MKRQKLVEKVRDIFESQGFDLQKQETGFTAEKGDDHLKLKVYSSEDTDAGSIEGLSEFDTVFVDESLSDIEDSVDTDVSVLREDEGRSYSVPSYERIGDIVVVSELVDQGEEDAVEAILEHNPGIDSILLKEKQVSGEFRVGGYRSIYGDTTETVHREHGCRIKVDPTKMFFSEREGTERRRIFEKVERGEDVLVMFSGAGPFPVTMAVNAEPARVVGIEKNPEAVEFARENVKTNDVEDTVEILQGDVEDICPDLGEFDRVLTPSPTHALQFLDEATDCTAPGGILTVYSIQDKENPYQAVESALEEASDSSGFKILRRRIVSDFSPSKRKVAVDARKEP